MRGIFMSIMETHGRRVVFRSKPFPEPKKKRGDFLTLTDPRSTEFRVLHFHFSCVICHKPKTEPLANLERCCLCTKSCWTLVNQAPLSMVFPRQEYWNGLPFPSQGSLPHPGIKSMSPAWQANSLPLSYQGSPLTYNVLANN